MSKLISILFVFIVIVSISEATTHISSHHEVTCSADIGDLHFGNYVPFETYPKQIIILLEVRCNMGKSPNNVYYTLTVHGGNSSNPLSRYMLSSSTGERLYYNIYTTGNCVFGDGSIGTCSINGYISSHRGHIGERTHSLVGKIFPLQNVKAATDYIDILYININY